MEVLLGTKERGGSEVWIDGNARRKHMAIFGKSGVGKTTLMRNMIVADLRAGTSRHRICNRRPQASAQLASLLPLVCPVLDCFALRGVLL
jgi:ABC-type molybdate transport system ATPase subunit